MLVMLGLQVVFPVAVIVWLGARRHRSVASWMRGSGLVLGCIAAVSLALPWLLLPTWTGVLLLAGWGFASVWSWRRLNRSTGTPRRGSAWITAALETLVLVAGWTIAGLAVDGHRLPPGETLDIACPLGSGTYLVASGGSREVINPHLATLGDEPRYVPWRGQSHGVDIVEVDGFGRRARGLAPRNLSDYFVYGQLVVAPCDGMVVAATDGRPDMPPGVRDPDRTQLAGNHAIIQCGAYEVLLGHLQPGSVRLVPGVAVSTGDMVGFVGNSGNTDEPHLHVSAQRRSEDAPAIGGVPVWLTIEGMFAVRNDRVDCR
jgi:hypothetical protein